MEPTSSRDTRTVVVLVVTLAVNAAVQVGGYQAAWMSIAFWVIAGGGLVLLVWPDLPRRISDRLAGNRSWHTSKPSAPHPLVYGELVLTLTPPPGLLMRPPLAEGDEPDSEGEFYMDIIKPSCEVESPDGTRSMLDVRAPHTIREDDGTWNVSYRAVFPPEAADDDWRRSPLDVGSYRVVWRRTQGQPGHAILRIQRFRITTSGKVKVR